MNKEEPVVSRRLKEVWEWKDAIYRKVAHLPLDEALKEVLRKAHQTAKELDLPCRSARVTKKKRQ